jgi:hypothetical protein
MTQYGSGLAAQAGIQVLGRDFVISLVSGAQEA